MKNDEVHQYIQLFYKMQTKVILKERESREKRQQQNDESTLRRMDRNVSTYGNDSQRAEYQRLKQQYETMKDPDSKQFVMLKMDRLESDIVFNNFDWLKMIFLQNYAMAMNYTDLQKAEFWKGEGAQAVQNRSATKLLQVINNLGALRIKSASESVNVMLSDLKKY